MTELIAALHPGAAYHCETLEGPRYHHHFDRLIRPEALDAAALDGVATLIVPCRTHPDRVRLHWPLMAGFLAQGGTVIAMGETFQDEWIPGVTFHPLKTNYWWWLQDGADLGMRVVDPGHPLVADMTTRHVTWHQHGWFDLPEGARPLVADTQGRTHLYVDEATFGGRLVVTSLDPMYHHGSGFMPSTTMFLDAFLPNLRQWSTDLTTDGAAFAVHQTPPGRGVALHPRQQHSSPCRS